MIIENEFSVGAEIDEVWRQLLDMEGVASCLPGATIRATETENVYDGSMRLKIGPMRVEYRGTATLGEIDEANHTAVISLSAREAKGQGSAMATIRNRLESTGLGTRVSAQTELQITGPQAQFGRGVIEDVGKRVLAEFSQRLEQKIAGTEAAEPLPGGEAVAPPGAGPAPGAAPPPGAGARAPAPPPVANELDVGSLVVNTPAVRIGGAALLLLLVLILLRRRR
jgi:carbon monoxide dehydrogenase subunit G